jgi:hypothetical protein
LRTWALEQFARLDELATRNTIDLKDRQMVEAFVERIEINPETKTGVVYLLADLEGALLRSSTRGPIGEREILAKHLHYKHDPRCDGDDDRKAHNRTRRRRLAYLVQHRDECQCDDADHN